MTTLSLADGLLLVSRRRIDQVTDLQLKQGKYALVCFIGTESAARRT